MVRAAVYVRNQANCVIKYRFAAGPEFERSGEAWLLREIAPAARTLVDAGANVGDWTAAALQYGHEPRVIAFEPSRSAVERLRDRFHDHPNVTICEGALGDGPGTAMFAEEHDAGTHSSLVTSFASAASKTRPVEVTTLDAELERLGIAHVDMLKVDCEGYDLHVLRGARRLLEDRRADVVQFEYNRPWAKAGSTLAAAYAVLENFGYRVFLLREDGLYDFDYGRYGEFFEYSNFAGLSAKGLRLLGHRIRGPV